MNVLSGSNSGASIQITPLNGTKQDIGNNRVDGGGANIAYNFTVQKGDTITISGSPRDYSAVQGVYARWYKNRDYSNR